MMTTEEKPSLRDVLYELSLSGPVPDAEILDDFIRRYPEHATALTEFAVELVLDAFGDVDDPPSDPPPDITSSTVSRAMSRFQNRLYEVKTTSTPQVSTHETNVRNPFMSLQRSDLRDLAQNLDVNTVFVMKLRDRQIQYDTIPQGFKSRVAEELKIPIEVVTEHLTAQPEVQRYTHFKSEQKPEAGTKQTFDEAVRSSGLTPKQQEYLLSL